MWKKISVVVSSVVVVVGLAVLLLLFHLEQTMQRRIVPAGPGTLMAIDVDGLRQLHTLYARPRICGDVKYRRSTDVVTVFELCDNVIPITSETLKKGLVLLPARTRAVSLETRYILKGGDFAARSYSPASTAGMIKDGAVEVEYVRLSHPLDKNTRGWVVRGYMQCECGPFP